MMRSVALLALGRSPRLDGMVVFRGRFGAFAVVLAFLAVLGMGALTSWHGATPHNHDLGHAVSVELDDHQSRESYPDSPVHAAAHAVGQWLAIPDHVETPVLDLAASPIWPLGNSANLYGLDPSALLRPPRS
jgi:hypothetical protein